VEVKTEGGLVEHFDQVVIAAHSDQALALLEDPSPAEREILSGIPYQDNLAVLHTDASLMPRHKAAWSSWNYHIPRKNLGRVSLTYDMNILQGLQSPVEFCVTLNPSQAIDLSQTVARMNYHHPVYTSHGTLMQKRHDEINGVNRTWFCGAYWGYGFHEDGVNSALAVCRHFGEAL
jgi:predicted NAD/FAD-binding protein